MSQSELEVAFREEAMRWLDRRTGGGTRSIRYEDLTGFTFRDQRVPLLDRQRGIRKPAILGAALSLRTTYTPPGQLPPYDDAPGPDGLLRYKYRGTDPGHPENVALLDAMRHSLPLIWFIGIAPGVFQPVYPVWLIGNEPESSQFVVAVDEVQRLLPSGYDLTDDQRRYVTQLTRARLHQPVFRARVLQAYETRCAVCRLRHGPLLDAAHILPDGHPRGLPVVPNGLSLCKSGRTWWWRFVRTSSTRSTARCCDTGCRRWPA